MELCMTPEICIQNSKQQAWGPAFSGSAVTSSKSWV